MKISMARGDLFVFPFAVFLDNEQVTAEMDEIWFTVKKHYYDEEALFQHRLTDGGIMSDGEGTYTVTIAPEDTEELAFGQYDFDIQVEKSGTLSIKRTFYGTLNLGPEVTHKGNEGA